MSADDLTLAPPEIAPEELDAIAQAREIATDVLAANAARYDAGALFPADNFAAIHAAGLIGVVVPREHGGLGLRPLAYARLLKELAKGCAATAGSFHMHNSVMRFLSIFGTDEQKETYYAEAVDSGALFGSWGAEPSTSWAGPVALSTAYTEADGGYRVTGSKYFASLGEGASYGLLYAVAAEVADNATIDDVQFFVVDTAQDGVDVRDEWDTLGMRATVSKPVILTDAFVPPVGRIGKPGDIRNVSTEFYSLGYAAFYQGIAEAAFERAIHHAQTRTIRPSNRPISQYERVQRKIGEMSLDVHAGALAVDHAARTMQSTEVEGSHARLHASMQAKALTTRVVLSVTNLALEVAGGPGAIRGNVFERYLRDGRTAVLMVPAYDQCLETVAKQDLGLGEREFS